MKIKMECLNCGHILWEDPETALDDKSNWPKSDYYSFGGIETIDFIEAKELNFSLGSAVKYIARAGKKLGEAYEKDLGKALSFIQREIERVRK